MKNLLAEIPPTPATLRPGGEGEQLWVWLHQQSDSAGDCRPLVIELCTVADRLEECRTKIGQQGLLVSGVRGRSAKNPLLDAEIKLSRQYQLLWRTLGLADKPNERDGSLWKY